jgi:hypothetical protein
LLSILKENTIKQLIQEKPLGNIKSYVPGTSGSDFVQAISNEEIDAQALLETVVVWTEIKQDLNYINNISNTINTWTSQLFDVNMDENIDSNMVLTTNIQTITHPTDKPNLLKSINTLSNIYQGDTKEKYQNNYKIPSSYDYATNNFYEKQNNTEKINSEKSLFSIIYLWNMYSDIIVITIGVLIVLIAISGLIKFLSK